MPNHQDNQHFEAALALTIHDIKNSLALLLDDLAKSKHPQTESHSKYEIRRINNNLIRLLGLYKIGAEHYAPTFDYQYLGELLHEVAADYQEMLQQKAIRLEISCQDELQIKLDKPLVYGVLENALNNAARYTKSIILMQVEEDDKWIRLSIEDDGKGFPEQMLSLSPNNFKEARFDMRAGTTGLGLYFAHVVAQLHTHGDISGHMSLSNDSRFGGGRFTLHLPQQELPDFSFVI